MSDFIHFSDIDPSRAETWSGKRILSIDVDWAADEVLQDTLEIVELAGVKATFFVTHNSPIIDWMRANDKIEIGLHPNFDPLLRGEGAESARDILLRLTAALPGLKVLRSHAMTTSGRWLDVYREVGVTHLSNYLMFGDRNIHPFRQLNGLIEAPVYFADDGMLYQRAKDGVTFDVDRDLGAASNGLQVYNFHPIHVFLNSESLDRYEAARPFAGVPESLRKMRFTGHGARTWLNSLLA